MKELCECVHHLSFMWKDPVRACYVRHRACRRIEISAGEGQYWHEERGLVLTSPDTAGRGFTIPGWSLAGDRTQTWEYKMAAVAISFVTVDRCFIILEGHS